MSEQQSLRLVTTRVPQRLLATSRRPEGTSIGWSWTVNPQAVSLAAGAFAGTATETLLFPLDSLKTRLQSRTGFYQSGGCRGLYRGLGTAVCAAAPASAIFFYTYETTKGALAPHLQSDSLLSHGGLGLLSSIVGELAAGVYRVPMDLIKQRQQAGMGHGLVEVARSLQRTQRGVIFASYMSSFMRDIAHSSLQFPMYECFKFVLAQHRHCTVDQLPVAEAAMCGSVAGVISAALTTPLDVLRTRLNLRKSTAKGETYAPAARSLGALAMLREEASEIYRSRGVRGFFAGGACRSAWMGLGGFVFLGSFEVAKKTLMRSVPPDADALSRAVVVETKVTLEARGNGDARGGDALSAHGR